MNETNRLRKLAGILTEADASNMNMPDKEVNVYGQYKGTPFSTDHDNNDVNMGEEFSDTSPEDAKNDYDDAGEGAGPGNPLSTDNPEVDMGELFPGDYQDVQKQDTWDDLYKDAERGAWNQIQGTPMSTDFDKVEGGSNLDMDNETAAKDFGSHETEFDAERVKRAMNYHAAKQEVQSHVENGGTPSDTSSDTSDTETNDTDDTSASPFEKKKAPPFEKKSDDQSDKSDQDDDSADEPKEENKKSFTEAYLGAMRALEELGETLVVEYDVNLTSVEEQQMAQEIANDIVGHRLTFKEACDSLRAGSGQINESGEKVFTFNDKMTAMEFGNTIAECSDGCVHRYAHGKNNSIDVIVRLFTRS